MLFISYYKKKSRIYEFSLIGKTFKVFTLPVYCWNIQKWCPAYRASPSRYPHSSSLADVVEVELLLFSYRHNFFLEATLHLPLFRSRVFRHSPAENERFISAWRWRVTGHAASGKNQLSSRYRQTLNGSFFSPCTHTHKTVNATHFFPQWRVAVHAAAWLKVCTYVLIHKLKQYATYSTWKTGDRKGTKINSENIIAVN